MSVGPRTGETLAAMRALWRGEQSFVWRGATVGDVAMRPAPARAGGPPVWTGGDSDAGIRRASRSGVAWHTAARDPERLAERLAVLNAALAAAGRRRRGDFLVSVRVRATPERVAQLAPALAELGVGHLLVEPPAFDPVSFLALATRLRAIVGSDLSAIGARHRLEKRRRCADGVPDRCQAPFAKR